MAQVIEGEIVKRLPGDDKADDKAQPYRHPKVDDDAGGVQDVVCGQLDKFFVAACSQAGLAFDSLPHLFEVGTYFNVSYSNNFNNLCIYPLTYRSDKLYIFNRTHSIIPRSRKHHVSRYCQNFL